MYKTGVVADRRYLKHFAGRAHPERPERIEAMIEMAESLTRPDLKFMAPREATQEEIASCHAPDMSPRSRGRRRSIDSTSIPIRIARATPTIPRCFRRAGCLPQSRP